MLAYIFIFSYNSANLRCCVVIGRLPEQRRNPCVWDPLSDMQLTVNAWHYCGFFPGYFNLFFYNHLLTWAKQSGPSRARTLTRGSCWKVSDNGRVVARCPITDAQTVHFHVVRDLVESRNVGVLVYQLEVYIRSQPTWGGVQTGSSVSCAGQVACQAWELFTLIMMSN